VPLGRERVVAGPSVNAIHVSLSEHELGKIHVKNWSCYDYYNRNSQNW